jgi:hypothetical protein
LVRIVQAGAWFVSLGKGDGTDLCPDPVALRDVLEAGIEGTKVIETAK